MVLKVLQLIFLFLTGMTIILLVALPDTDFNFTDGIVIMGLITITNKSATNASNKKNSIIDNRKENYEKDNYKNK